MNATIEDFAGLVVSADVEGFLAALAEAGMNERTLGVYRTGVERFAEFLAPRPLAAAVASDGEAFIAYLEQLGVTETSRRAYRKVLARWFEHAAGADDVAVTTLADLPAVGDDGAPAGPRASGPAAAAPADEPAEFSAEVEAHFQATAVAGHVVADEARPAEPGPDEAPTTPPVRAATDAQAAREASFDDVTIMEVDAYVESDEGSAGNAAPVEAHPFDAHATEVSEPTELVATPAGSSPRSSDGELSEPTELLPPEPADAPASRAGTDEAAWDAADASGSSEVAADVASSGPATGESAASEAGASDDAFGAFGAFGTPAAEPSFDSWSSFDDAASPGRADAATPAAPEGIESSTRGGAFGLGGPPASDVAASSPPVFDDAARTKAIDPPVETAGSNVEGEDDPGSAMVAPPPMGPSATPSLEQADELRREGAELEDVEVAAVPFARSPAGDTGAASAAAPAVTAPPPTLEDDRCGFAWAIDRRGRRRSGLDLAAIRDLVLKGELDPTDKVRRPGGDWMSAGSFAPLRPAFEAAHAPTRERVAASASRPLLSEATVVKIGAVAGAVTAAGAWWLAALLANGEVALLAPACGLVAGMTVRLLASRPSVAAGLAAAASVAVGAVLGRVAVFLTISSGVLPAGGGEGVALPQFLASGLTATAAMGWLAALGIAHVTAALGRE